MNLNYLLSEQGIDATKTSLLAMRHVPTESELRRVLPWLAAERPDVFNAYQQSHAPHTEAKLKEAAYLASFIGVEPKEALFVGIYKIRGYREISFEQYWRLSGNRTLRDHGMTGWVKTKQRPSTLWFNLELRKELRDLKGKLIVRWPAERAWTQRVSPNKFPVKALLEESALDRGMPVWSELQLTWAELAHLPSKWKDVLAQWRGIYFIFDSTDGKGYVGAAYSDMNLYGRWMRYASSGDGGNKLLRRRAPSKFIFSILELVSPTMKPDDVVKLESSWKDRLHTRKFGLNIN